MTTPKRIFSDIPALSQPVGLVDVVNRLLDRGVVVLGQSTISVAGVDLIHLRLHLLLSSVETLRQHLHAPGPAQPIGEGSQLSASVIDSSARSGLSAMDRGVQRPPVQPVSSPVEPSLTIEGLDTTSASRPEQGLAQLVLTLVELLRQLLEHQAVRRMEGGSLAAEEIERMGLALLDLEAKMEELRQVFSLTKEDLNLNLGSILGDLDGE